MRQIETRAESTCHVDVLRVNPEASRPDEGYDRIRHRSFCLAGKPDLLGRGDDKLIGKSICAFLQ